MAEAKIQFEFLYQFFLTRKFSLSYYFFFDCVITGCGIKKKSLKKGLKYQEKI